MSTVLIRTSSYRKTASTSWWMAAYAQNRIVEECRAWFHTTLVKEVAAWFLIEYRNV